MSVYHNTPFTLDGRDIAPEAPRSQGMSDASAQAVIDGAEGLRSSVLHLHADVVDHTATINVANSPVGSSYYLDFGDGQGTWIEHADELTEMSAEHTYLRDGVFTVALSTTAGQPASAQLELPINWPAPFPVPPAPETP